MRGLARQRLHGKSRHCVTHRARIQRNHRIRREGGEKAGGVGWRAGRVRTQRYVRFRILPTACSLPAFALLWSLAMKLRLGTSQKNRKEKENKNRDTSDQCEKGEGKERETSRGHMRTSVHALRERFVCVRERDTHTVRILRLKDERGSWPTNKHITQHKDPDNGIQHQKRRATKGAHTNTQTGGAHPSTKQATLTRAQADSRTRHNQRNASKLWLQDTRHHPSKQASYTAE